MTLRVRLSSGGDEDAFPAGAETFRTYFEEQARGRRSIFVAECDGELAGYVTVLWTADDRVLREAGIPEISDLRVLKRFRRRGIGTALLDRAEAEAAGRGPKVGLNVGLHSGYGAAQRLYARRGYLPDGSGVVVEGETVPEGETISLDDDPILTLRMTKAVAGTGPRKQPGEGPEGSENPVSTGGSTLQTERLVLRPFELDDAPRVQELAGAPEIASGTLTVPHPYEDGMAEAWIEGQAAGREAGTDFVFAIVHEPEGLIGTIGLHLTPRHRRAELGYWIGVPYWGRGFATEAAAAALEFGFGELGLHRVFARYYARNPASGRVLEKLGMRHEGLQRQHVLKWDRFEDLECCGIVESEWRARKRPSVRLARRRAAVEGEAPRDGRGGARSGRAT